MAGDAGCNYEGVGIVVDPFREREQCGKDWSIERSDVADDGILEVVPRLSLAFRGDSYGRSRSEGSAFHQATPRFYLQCT